MSDALKLHLLGKTDLLGATIRDGCPKPEGCEDWEYRDIPWLGREMWNFVADMMVPDVRVIAMSTRPNKAGEPERRGQFWVSPEACRRLAEYAEATSQ